MVNVLGGDDAALALRDTLRDRGVDATLILPEPPIRDAPDAVHAKGVRVVRMEHRVCGLITHRDDDGIASRPGPVVLAGRRPTRLWTGDGGLGHGLALGLLAGAEHRDLDDVRADGPRGGLATGDGGRTGVAGVFALGGATAGSPPVEEVADAVADEPVPARIPARDRDPVDRPMPDGFAEPKMERLAEIVGPLRPDTDEEDLARAGKEVRGLLGEMRSYLQARRSEELLDLRDAVVVALAVVEALQARRGEG